MAEGFEPYDWENAYIDPNYLFLNFYCTFYIYGDFRKESRNDSLGTEGNRDINFDRYYNATITYRVKNWKSQEPEIKIYGIYEEIQKDIRKIISNHLRSQDRLFLDVDIGIGFNKGTCKYNIPHKPEESSYSINPVASLGISYFFNDGPQKITNGFSVGLNYSSFQITSDYVTYFDSIQNQQDILSEDYTKLISGSNIKQTADLSLIGLYAAFKSKLKLKELSKSRLLNLYLNLGVNYSYISTYVTSIEDPGSITYRGKYYFAFPGDISNYYILENISSYGYYTTSDLQITENSNNTPKHAVSAYVTLGLGYEISNNWSFNISGKYNYGFMPGLSPVSNP
ncbi:MAG: hypothetical protein KAT74_01765, partial [Candidatus Cloacimonetes bacterium]|nr:hypothetical protein [Candidatus Cloacimonadota bacterium]